jgi:hypothetical protein
MLKQEITDEDFIKTEKVIHHCKAIDPRDGNCILLYKNHFTIQQKIFMG